MNPKRSASELVWPVILLIQAFLGTWEHGEVMEAVSTLQRTVAMLQAMLQALGQQDRIVPISQGATTLLSAASAFQERCLPICPPPALCAPTTDLLTIALQLALGLLFEPR